MKYLIAIFALALTACNTVNGMGKDIQSLGQGMQSSSQSSQPTQLNGTTHQGY